MLKIGLVPCCKEKSNKIAAAINMYRSPLFQAMIKYAEAHCHVIGIISGKHGLILPWQVIQPYDYDLNRQTAPQRKSWSIRTGGQIERMWPEGAFMVLCEGVYIPELHGRDQIYPLRALNISLVRQKLMRLTESPWNL